MRKIHSSRRLCRILAWATVAWLAGAHSSFAGGTLVYPTGLWPDDVHHVQAAIDQGGTVVLKAINIAGDPTAFNFGPAARLPDTWVYLRADVNIIGERASDGSRTTIHGGWGPFTGTEPVRTRIQGLDFDGPLSDAIEIDASGGIEIVDNHIRNVVPNPLPVGFTFGDGIDFFQSGAITGSVRIANNTVEGLTADFSIGIQLDFVTGDVEISSNVVSIGQTLGTGGIESEGILVIRSLGAVRVNHNTILLGPGRAFAGLFLGGHRAASYSVAENVVRADPGTPPAAFGDLRTGIWVEGGRINNGMVAPRLHSNEVTMHNGDCAICVVGGVTDGSFAGNKVMGDGENGLVVSNIFADVTSSNQFVGEDFSQFQAATVHGYFPAVDVMLDLLTRDNIVEGRCTSAIDLGTNNRVSCHAPNVHATGSGFAVVQSLPMSVFPDLDSKLRALGR